MTQHDERGLSDDTIHTYLKALSGIFVIEDAPAWCPALRAKETVRTSDTRYFTDPSIAAASLGVTPDDLVNDLRSFGYFFEGMAMRDLRTFLIVLDIDHAVLTEDGNAVGIFIPSPGSSICK